MQTDGTFPKEHLHRLVRILYKIRKPHCRQRTGSPALILLRAPQSPHRYSTPRNCSKDDTAAAGAPAEVVAVVVAPFILYLLSKILLFFDLKSDVMILKRTGCLYE